MAGPRPDRRRRPRRAWPRPGSRRTIRCRADFAASLKPPGTPGHPLGTDQLGRDLLARVLHGARLALFIGVCTVLVTAVVGGLLGLRGRLRRALAVGGAHAPRRRAALVSLHPARADHQRDRRPRPAQHHPQPLGGRLGRVCARRARRGAARSSSATSSTPPPRWASAGAGCCSATCCRTWRRRSSWWPACSSRSSSWPRPPSASSASACSRPRRPGAAC